MENDTPLMKACKKSQMDLALQLIQTGKGKLGEVNKRENSTDGLFRKCGP